jgi:phosphoglycerol transferase MdoB-like AlkP superfamily enzyme
MDNVVTEAVANDLFGNNTLMEFLVRFGINLLFIIIIVRFIYYPRHRNKDFLFTFFLFNTVNFIICFLLSDTKLKTGFAFGLFAIFSIIRYRTVTVPIREMGYFFVAVTVGLINSLAVLESTQTAVILLLSNTIIIGLILLLDRQLSLDHENYKEINYERIDLIKPELRNEMIEDIKKRTGLPIHRVELIKVDFLRDVARIHAFYYSKDNESTTRGMGADDE